MALTAPGTATHPAPTPGEDALAGLVTAALLVLLGAPLGLLWARTAPVVSPEQTDLDLEALLVGSRDGAFVVLSLVAGALAGGLAFALARRWGPGVVLGLLVGGLGAGAVAAHVGRVASALPDGPRTAPFRVEVVLEVPVAVVALPLAALVVFGGLVLLDRPDRAEVSSG